MLAAGIVLAAIRIAARQAHRVRYREARRRHRDRRCVVFVVFAIFFGYFIIFEAFWNGQTPGKTLLGMRVVRDGGFPIDFGAALVRNLVRVGELSLGLLRHLRGQHDAFAREQTAWRLCGRDDRGARRALSHAGERDERKRSRVYSADALSFGRRARR